MGQWDKLIADILALNPNLHFEELSKALRRVGYTTNQPKAAATTPSASRAVCP